MTNPGGILPGLPLLLRGLLASLAALAGVFLVLLLFYLTIRGLGALTDRAQKRS